MENVNATLTDGDSEEDMSTREAFEKWFFNTHGYSYSSMEGQHLIRANAIKTGWQACQAHNDTVIAELVEAYKSAIQSIDDYDCYDRRTGNICFKHEIFKWDMEFILEIEGKNEQSFNSN